jgi:hypothetical protein
VLDYDRSMKITSHDGLRSMGREVDRGRAGHRLVLVTARFFRATAFCHDDECPALRTGRRWGPRPVGSRQSHLGVDPFGTLDPDFGMRCVSELGTGDPTKRKVSSFPWE